MRKNNLKSILTVIMVGALLFVVYKAFLAPNGKFVPAFSENGLHVVIEGDVIDGKGEPQMVNGHVLLPLRMVRDCIDPTIDWDEKAHKLTVTTENRVIRMKTGSLDGFVNNKAVRLNIPVREENGTVLVPIEFLDDFYSIDTQYIGQSNVVIIDFTNRQHRETEPLKSGAVIRAGHSIHEPVIEKYTLAGTNSVKTGKTEGTGDEAAAVTVLKASERLKNAEAVNGDLEISAVSGTNKLRVYGEYENWYRVRTSDGAVGYIEKKYVAKPRTIAARKAAEDTAQTAWKPVKGKISMAWDYIRSVGSDLSGKTAVNGLDVISPTWFQVVATDGEVENHADKNYVEWAHHHGYKVWALVSNSFDEPEMSGEFLNGTDSRENAIRQLLAFASLYRLDGLNVDFEGMDAGDREAFSQFIRELSPLLREQGLAVSVDINTAACYDRKALGKAADYIALMAYDQYWTGSDTAGSVAQLDWTEQTLRSFLEDIPAQKMLLGMPFYTRLWKETSKGGRMELSSKALSMKGIEKVLKENHASKTWDSKSGQFYSEFVSEGATYKVWLEDENSLNLRTSLVQKYSLAGAAAWRLDFELPGVWNVIGTNLKKVENYSEWKLRNKAVQFAYSK